VLAWIAMPRFAVTATIANANVMTLIGIYPSRDYRVVAGLVESVERFIVHLMQINKPSSFAMFALECVHFFFVMR